jgi:hypothetical protein
LFLGGFIFHERGAVMMNGILAYSDDVNAGVIKGHDGERYHFPKAEWRSPEIKPQVNMLVIFQKDNKSACNVQIELAPTSKENGTT